MAGAVRPTTVAVVEFFVRELGPRPAVVFWCLLLTTGGKDLSASSRPFGVVFSSWLLWFGLSWLIGGAAPVLVRLGLGGVLVVDGWCPQGPQLQKTLERLTGQHTVPNVFIEQSQANFNLRLGNISCFLIVDIQSAGLVLVL
ncbi:unnamed protein product [Fraxinus pennsylvanica]|uniref:Uncharacterized protein n=1 Tax=Fraxinus pennsylvanica TaxID=56036 RepID=A0AAD1ZIU9_9LAMI|nr:unnamed protein product [Fraxinus pennsylvanica]